MERRLGAKHRVFIVEDEQSVRDVLAELFEVEGNEVVAAATLDEAHAALAARPFDLIVTDLRLGSRHDGGLQVMAAAGLLSPDAAMVVLTAYPADDNRQASSRLGAAHFVEKPTDIGVIATLAARYGVGTALGGRETDARPVARTEAETVA